MSRRRFTREFKVQAAQRLLAGESGSAVARELDVKRAKLYEWASQLERYGDERRRRTTWSRDYTYDAWGNRGRATSGLSFDPATNRITTGAYDPAGNLTSLANVAQSMSYDANNKMTGFVGASPSLQEEGEVKPTSPSCFVFLTYLTALEASSGR